MCNWLISRKMFASVLYSIYLSYLLSKCVLINTEKNTFVAHYRGNEYLEMKMFLFEVTSCNVYVRLLITETVLRNLVYFGIFCMNRTFKVIELKKFWIKFRSIKWSNKADFGERRYSNTWWAFVGYIKRILFSINRCLDGFYCKVVVINRKVC